MKIEMSKSFIQQLNDTNKQLYEKLANCAHFNSWKSCMELLTAIEYVEKAIKVLKEIEKTHGQ